MNVHWDLRLWRHPVCREMFAAITHRRRGEDEKWLHSGDGFDKYPVFPPFVMERHHSSLQSGSGTERARELKHFLKNLASRCGRCMPRRRSNRTVVFLPVSMTKKAIYQSYCSCSPKPLSRNRFLEVVAMLRSRRSNDCVEQIWRKELKYLRIGGTQTDKCDTCLILSRNPDNAAELAHHRSLAKTMRDEYNSSIAGSKKTHGFVHVSFDFAQSVRIPCFPVQPSQIYFLTPLCQRIFGVASESVSKQWNYLICEGHKGSDDKGPNIVLSCLYDFILTKLQPPTSEFFDGFEAGARRKLHLNADNCKGTCCAPPSPPPSSCPPPFNRTEQESISHSFSDVADHH